MGETKVMLFGGCCLVIKSDNNNRNLKILAVSRKNDFNDFGLPGGKSESKEPMIRTARRELEEETGLWVLDERDLVPVYSRISLGKDGYLFCSTFLVTETRGEFMQEKNGGRIAWVHPAILVRGCFGDYNVKLFENLLINYETDEQDPTKLIEDIKANIETKPC